MSKILQNLERIANAAAGRQVCRSPWRYRDGTVATDGRLLLWVPRVWSRVRKPAAVDATALDGLFEPRGDTLGVSQVADLRQWAEPAVWSVPCPACKGVSKDSEYVMCSFCESDGIASPDIRPGYLCGVPIDRNNLGKLLEYWPQEAVTLRSVGPDLPLYLCGTWRGILQPMRTDGPDLREQWAAAPRLNLPQP